MPTTRSSAKKKAQSAVETWTTQDETSSPRSRIESHARSQSDLDIVTSPFKLPFFEENSISTSGHHDIFLSPSNSQPNANTFTQVMSSSEWEHELSPIVRSRDSDASQDSLRASTLDYGVLTQLEMTGVQQGRPEDKFFRFDAANKDNETLLGSPSLQQDEEVFCDLTCVRQQVGQSSHEFIERIRNAAHRRKVAMTRSRDSLVAKEQEQLRSNAEKRNKENPDTLGGHEIEESKNEKTSTATENRTFKARPLPPTTGSLGSGGLDGVPKVEKRPTTTPFSPLLGARRHQKVKIHALARPKQIKPPKSQPKPVTQPRNFETTQEPRSKNPIPTTSDGFARPFKARAVPLSVRAKENGGQYGIPKVEKRPVTVATSPMLGLRRRSRSPGRSSDTRKVKPTQNNASVNANDRKGAKTLIRSLSRSSSSILTARTIGAESPLLLGLKLLTTPRAEQGENDENTTPNHAPFKPYEPHSTRRAIMRAEFDIRRKTIFEMRIERETQEREKIIRSMHRDLDILRQEI